MANHCMQTFLGPLGGGAGSTYTWTAPPGYKGPVLVDCYEHSVGYTYSQLRLVEPGQTYTIFFDPNLNHVSFGGVAINKSVSPIPTGFESVNVTWWPGIVSHIAFTTTPAFGWLWKSPPGYNGPVLIGASSGSNANFGGGVNYNQGVGNPNESVECHLVEGNNTYIVSILGLPVTGSVILAWFP